jgi:hypothetical protein
MEVPDIFHKSVVGRASVPANQGGQGRPLYRYMIASYEDQDCCKFF